MTTTSSTEYIDNNIELGVNYCYNVRTYCGDGNFSGFSEEACAQVGDKPCNAPTNLNATIEQNAEGFDYNFKVTMTWDKLSNAKSYIVYLDGEMLDSTTENSYVKGFDEEGTHSFTVASVCENGESEQSEAFEFEVKAEYINEIENNFEIYPNPTKDFVKITGSHISTVKIYNYLGILVKEIEANSNEIEIEVSNYNSGIYFIEINTENGNNIKRIIKN